MDSSPRRPSLAKLYNNLKAQSDPYEELEHAARLFPMDEDELEYTSSTVSSRSSQAPSFGFDDPDDESEDEADSSSDEDSDVEPLELPESVNPAAYPSHFVRVLNDTPFLPPRAQSVEINQSELPPRKLPLAPSTAHRRAIRVRDDDSDREADCESTGDATDDEYMPSPTLNPRKRTRSPSPTPFRHRIATSPGASSSSSGYSNKRTRLPPPSRNKQASVDEIEGSDDYNDFVCRVCGWVQKNHRLPDFRRHVKTHQRTVEEEAQKGWRCKGVLLSEAAEYSLPSDATSYVFQGRERVGGCMKTFSRRDALKRHLDNKNVACVGHPTAATHN
ncbi:hypothetical protein FB45DRAFT_1020813 [Roridomyces roridus]|uniref:C2H2-type domain-containing protein n=1 Tax=Roridomyces roridus TaxID=1738132 RepID=A0AAD7FXT3_9AGAR|nr:hypothetical protein FB45DRAFT_1020813 [Roridomyces roridus]